MLIEVEADQQPAAVAGQASDRAEQTHGRPWAEVADRRAREVDDATRSRFAGRGERQGCGEIGVDGKDEKTGETLRQGQGRPLDRFARDVDRHISPRRPT